MESISSLPLLDRDTLMRRVARELAMDLYPLDQILKNCEVTHEEFARWKDRPEFTRYYLDFKQEWHSAVNSHERTKVKASIVMEEFMQEAYKELHSPKNALNHRVELGKLVAKIAGMGEPKFAAQAGAGGGFSLSININTNERVTIQPEVHKVINHDPVSRDEFEDYDPFTSPDTLAAE